MHKFAMLALIANILFTNPVPAQSKIGLYGVGGQLGWINAEPGIGATPGYSLNFDMGTLLPGVRWYNSLDFWTKSYNSTQFFKDRWSHWGFCSQIKYRFKTRYRTLAPFLGSGLGLYVSYWHRDFSSSAKDSSRAEGSDTQINLAVSVLAGLEYRLTRTISLMLRADYHIDGVDFSAVYLGVWWQLPKRGKHS